MLTSPGERRERPDFAAAVPPSRGGADRFDKTYFDSGRGAAGRFSTYDSTRLYPAYLAVARKLLGIQHPAHVLDAGCAKGVMVRAFRDCGVDCSGVDFSEYALSKADPGVLPFLHRVDLSTEKLPFEDNSFELVTAMGVLDYVADFDHAAGELRRVISPGGLLFITAACRIRPEDTYRVRAMDEAAWTKTFSAHGFEASTALTQTYSWEIMRVLLSSAESSGARLASILARAPPLNSIVRHYLEKEHCVLLLFPV